MVEPDRYESHLREAVDYREVRLLYNVHWDMKLNPPRNPHALITKR